MIPIGKRVGTALAVSLLLGGCGKIRNEIRSLEKRVRSEIDAIFDRGFYSDPGCWDYYRMPLIEPWELSACIWDEKGLQWGCGVKTDCGSRLIPTIRRSVERIGITDSIIYYRYSADLLPESASRSADTSRYVIIDTRCDSVMRIDDERSFCKALRRLNVPAPCMFSVDCAYANFANRKILLFRLPNRRNKARE